MNKKKDKYGIWGGRFQIIHRGHEYVMKYVSHNYNNVCIGIVNPNPNKPAWSILEHEKFAPSRNPLSYFERAYLWNKLLRENSIDAVIVPHWHPRKSLKLEKTFLPDIVSDREWIIPNLDGEEYKIDDLMNQGETVFVLSEIPPEIKTIHSSEINARFLKHDRYYKEDIPPCIQDLTEVFLSNSKYDRDFIIVPIFGDDLHTNLFCSSICAAFDNNKIIIFAPIVNVQNYDDWWKYDINEDDDSLYSFYKKSEIINLIMKKMQFYDYLTIPLILRKEVFQDLDAFFPEKDKRSWLIIKRINNGTGLKEIIRHERTIVIDNSYFKRIPNELFLEVAGILAEAYQEKHKLLSLI